MPAKRRKDKRRATLPPEAFEVAFMCRFDYFEALAPLGLVEPIRTPPESKAREVAQAAWDEALRDAWAREGAAFMASWEPQLGRALPWAAEAFGLPDIQGGCNAS
jgi:hypothetical protein